ncbi:MAG: L-lactate dehydrogenase [Synechococcaceae cyanobacterium SM2_3_2]|nr:L-lactate dehydrogenase [Synechococcaceae cyanobacterium SM2_3_2]
MPNESSSPSQFRRLLKGSIIGTGQVGMACAYSMVIQNTVDELILVDINQEKAEGEAMDLNHGMPFVEPTLVRSGDLAACAGSDVVVITAGAKQRPGESRLDLVQRNADIFKDLIGQVAHHCPDSILVIVSNPVDVMTYLAIKFSGFPAKRVIGSGTVLDTARFRYLLASRLSLDPRSLHAYIIGEHGDSEVAVWSKVNVAGTPVRALLPAMGLSEDAEDKDPLAGIFDQVRDAAYEIIQRKGATSYAIGLGVTQLVQAILRNQNRVLTISTLLTGQYDLAGVCLSLPCVVGREGIRGVLTIDLTDEEQGQLQNSGQILKQTIDQVQL